MANQHYYKMEKGLAFASPFFIRYLKRHLDENSYFWKQGNMMLYKEPETIYNSLPSYFENGDIIGARNLIETMQFKADAYYSKIIIISILINIFEIEVIFESKTTIFDNYIDIETMIDEYIQLKIYVHRIEFNIAPETHKDVYNYLKKNRISIYCLQYLISQNTVYTKETYSRFAMLYFEQEGENSLIGNFLSGFAEKQVIGYECE